MNKIVNPYDFRQYHNQQAVVSRNIQKEAHKVLGSLEIYYDGLLQANLVGGTIDGTTYNGYNVNFFLHHTFSTKVPNAVPHYLVYNYQNTFNGRVQTTLGNNGNLIFPIISGVTGGSVYSTSNSDYMTQNDATHGNDVLYMSWVLIWTSGSITIAPQTFMVAPCIFYSMNSTTPLTPLTGGSGGAGNFLVENFDFYI